MCLSVSQCAYISDSMGRILMKLGGNVETQVQLAVLQFHKNRVCDDAISNLFFFAKGKNSAAKGNDNYVTQAIAILFIG